MRRTLFAAGLIITLLGSLIPGATSAVAIESDVLKGLPGGYDGRFHLEVLQPLNPQVFDNWVELDISVGIDESVDPAGFVVVAQGTGRIEFQAVRDGFTVCISIDHTIGPLQAFGAVAVEDRLLHLEGDASLSITAKLDGCGGAVVASASQVVPVLNFGLDEFGFAAQMGGFSTESLDIETMIFDGSLTQPREADIVADAPPPTPETVAADDGESGDDDELDGDEVDDDEDPFEGTALEEPPLTGISKVAHDLAPDWWRDPDKDISTKCFSEPEECWFIEFDDPKYPEFVPRGPGWYDSPGADYARAVLAHALFLAPPKENPSPMFPVIRAGAPILIHLVEQARRGNQGAAEAADSFATLLEEMELERRAREGLDGPA